MVQCECGAVTGEPCGWSGPAALMVLVEWMPRELRDSHTAARNRGVWPANGALRLRMEQTCADLIVETEGDWAEIVA